MNKEQLPLCECGCGERVAKKGNRFINHHSARCFSEEAREKMRIVKLGSVFSPEHRKKLGDANRNPSEETRRKMRENHADVNGDKNPMYGVRGGNDLVTHHYIYDESDLPLNTVEMTRSDHMSLHRLLQKLGYIIPHINIKE